MPVVLMMIDAAAEWPVLVGDDKELLTGPDVRQRPIAEVEERQELRWWDLEHVASGDNESAESPRRNGSVLSHDAGA
jgi:hypothetical protein